MNTQLFEIDHGRSNHLIDPTLHIWGWEVPVYLFLGGLVAGLMIMGPALELRTKTRSQALQHVPLLAIILLSLGMGALFLDLEYPLHVYRFYLTLQPTSPMSWGSWILMGVYPVLILAWLSGLGEASAAQVNRLPLVERLGAWGRQNRALLLWTSLALGIGLGTYTGLLLGTMAARLQWNTAVLGPLFLVSGSSTGAALLLLLGPEEDRKALLVRWDSVAILTELALIVLMLFGFQSGGEAGRFAASALLGGEWTPWFWSLVVIAGLVVPLALNLVELRRHLPMTRVSPALVLFGGLALRFILVSAGQESSFASLP